MEEDSWDGTARASAGWEPAGDGLVDVLELTQRCGSRLCFMQPESMNLSSGEPGSRVLRGCSDPNWYTSVGGRDGSGAEQSPWPGPVAGGRAAPRPIR